VEETVTAHPPKSLGKYMKHKQVKELFPADGPGSVFFGLGVKVPEGDLAVFAAQDILFPDDTPVEVSAEINDCLVAVTDTLAVDNPFAGAIFGHPQPLVNQSLQHLGPEDFGQGLVTEEVFGGLFPPQPYLFIDARPRNEDMNVGMIAQFS